MKRKILIVTDDAGESFEILYAMYRFKEAGMQPVLAATKKKRLNGVIHDFYPGWNTYIEKPGYLIEADVAISQVKAKDYDAMVLMGGRAPEFLRHHKSLIRLVKQFHQLGKGLFSVCHGIQILIADGLCQGKKMTCYCNVRLELELAGGKWINKESVCDGQFITAQTWESHADFYRDVFNYLES